MSKLSLSDQKKWLDKKIKTETDNWETEKQEKNSISF